MEPLGLANLAWPALTPPKGPLPALHVQLALIPAAEETGLAQRVQPVLTLPREPRPAPSALPALTPLMKTLGPALHVRQAHTQPRDSLTALHVQLDKNGFQDSLVVLLVRYSMANSSLFKVPIRANT